MKRNYKVICSVSLIVASLIFSTVCYAQNSTGLLTKNSIKTSELERTKEEIIKVAVSALDEAVAKGLVNVVDEDVYESIFSDKNINQEEDLEK